MPFDHTLLHYFPDGRWDIEEGLSGWNNTTRFVRAGGRKWVLRIYETHRDIDKIRYEHEILEALGAAEPSYRVPRPAKFGGGNTIARLTDGTDRLACVFSYIEGRRPEEGEERTAVALGAAVSELMRDLSALKISSSPVYRPYYELESAYPHCSSERVGEFCSSPPPEFAGEAVALQAIGEAYREFRGHLPNFRSLPHQLIHGDLNDSNILVEGEGDTYRVGAILDFEFCTWDLRAMELAVIVSGYLDRDNAIDLIERFLCGMGGHIQLEASEIEAVPLLVRLRLLDVFLHFLNRYFDGVDQEPTLKEQIRSVYRGLQSLENVSDQLERVIRRHLGGE
ncbi:phosphotransferase [Cohnella terricola]|uniref:Phosphotransferase n=1 Tax=Cohnella terricola TaxID=1289167 RepID=A0A559JQR6_9BACL|nr:phosphotransferase [Cohnella terricola]TVY02210.1 phosphotransferase [Cohnella terricola]